MVEVVGGLVAKLCPIIVIPWTVARQAPLSMGFLRQEYWSGLLFPSPGDPSRSGVKLGSPALQADSLPTEPPGKPLQMWKESESGGCSVVSDFVTLWTVCSPPGSSVDGILQARLLKWLAIPFLQRIFPNQGLNPGLQH